MGNYIKEIRQRGKDIKNMSYSVVCEVGIYENFTGVIMWGETEGAVENASFRLDNSSAGFKCVYFLSGFWINGTFDYGYWYGGIWQNGIWKRGNWKYGTWENGIWENGIWWDGIWKSGIWNGGTWRRGKWIVGKDKNGKLHKRNPTTW